MIKLFILLMCTLVIGYRHNCTRESLEQYLKISTYDFSIKLLDRVAQQTNGHFVYSPISTWLQLLALTDGAQGKTSHEIQSVTREKMVCSRKIVRDVFNALDAELSEIINRRSTFLFDNLLDVKKSFVSNVQMLNATKVVSVNFKSNTVSEEILNNIEDLDLNGTDAGMLNLKTLKMHVLMVTDLANLKVNWKSPFNPAYTQAEKFYSEDNVINGYVNMMSQIGYFNFNNIPVIDAQALELPFTNRVSMILLLPTNKGTVEDIFFKMRNIKMATILKQLQSNEPKLINLKLPRFNLTSNLDNIPELLFDMGIKRMFSPHLAQLKNISDYRVYVSLMANRCKIEVTEKGVSTSISPEAISNYEDSIDVFFNRPFAFLLLDKTTNVILFAGIYSEPALY